MQPKQEREVAGSKPEYKAYKFWNDENKDTLRNSLYGSELVVPQDITTILLNKYYKYVKEGYVLPLGINEQDLRVGELALLIGHSEIVRALQENGYTLEKAWDNASLTRRLMKVNSSRKEPALEPYKNKRPRFKKTY